MGKVFDFGPFWENATNVEVLSRSSENGIGFRHLQPEHQTSAVMRFREYRPERTLLGRLALGPVLSPSRITLEYNEKRGMPYGEGPPRLYFIN